MEKQSSESTNHDVIWDCESSLYDSFELKAFEKQLYSAISSRTLSLPHLSGRHDPPPPPPLIKSPVSKISRSFRKLIRSIFRPKSSRITNKVDENLQGYYVVYDELSTIPEVGEFKGVKRSASERFTAPSCRIQISS
ncbi:hypothetical protein ACS0TY_011678 [Phlomoides rotata]